MSSTITSSSSSSAPTHSLSPFHSFSNPTRWTPSPPSHPHHSRPPSTHSFPEPHTPTTPPPYLRPNPSQNLRPPISSHHALSELTRRHLSKLSVVTPRESDVDSVLSEPVSYSTSSYVAADMWLVHKDVDQAERALVQREKDKEKARPNHTSKPTDVFSSVQEAQDVSSKLVRLFFAGGAREVPGACGRRAAPRYSPKDRIRDDPANHPYRWDKAAGAWERRNPDNLYDSFGGYNKRRRFEKVRRLRWWLRRVAARIRGDCD